MESAVTISSELHDRLIGEAAASPGVEICGLLFGDATRIDDAAACRNVAARPGNEFEIDPGALIAAHRAARTGGPQLIGHYHSHPFGKAVPSVRDAEAAGEGDLWLIIGAGDVRLWRAVAGGTLLDRFEAVPLRVAPPCLSGRASP